MDNIGIIANKDKDINYEYTKMLVEDILSKGGKIRVASDIADEIGVINAYSEKDVLEGSQIIICLGGDGSFLKVARKVYDKNIPLLGINLGSLGFLTEVEKGEINIAVDRILQDKFEVENRMMLEVDIIRDGKIIANDKALNDAVISRGALSRILHINTYINNEFAEMFPGDGLIVSSPTGSTGYSLSAGGPIVEPDVDLIIVTPICPHILYSRSYITTGDRVVRVEIDEDHCHDAMVTIDGQKGYEVIGGDCIEIKKSEHYIKMIRINSRNFFNVLRTKIYGRGENLIRK